MADYTLNWSETSVGPTVAYDAPSSTAGALVVDTTNLPAGVGATGAVRWVNAPNNCNLGFSLPVTLTAAGVVTFYRMTSTEGNFDFLRFFIDGVEQTKWSGTTAWGQVSYNLTAGSHTLKWTYTKDGGGTGGEDTPRVALLKVTNVDTAPPVTKKSLALNTFDFENGAVPAAITTSTWTASTSSPISGTYSLRTPAVTANSATYTATCNVPVHAENAVVAFDYKRDAEGIDYSEFVLGSTSLFKSNAINTNLTTEARRLAFILGPSASPQTLTFKFVKDGSSAFGADATWIDNLAIPTFSDFTSTFSGSGSLTSKVLPHVSRTNLIKNPSFEQGSLYGWNGAVTAGSTVLDNTRGYSGTSSLKLTATGSGARVRGSNGAAQVTEMAPIVPGTYVLSAYVYFSVGQSAKIYAFGADATGAPTGIYNDATGNNFTVPTAQWARIYTTFTVGASSTDKYVYPNIEIAGSTSGQTFNIDAVQLTQTSTLGNYFDGSTAAGGGFAYDWVGTPGQSASVEMAASGNFMNSGLSGSGTLASALTYSKKISSGLSGSGTLDAKLRRNIASGLSGSGTLTSVVGQAIKSNLSGSGTLTSSLRRYITSGLSGSGTLGSALTGYRRIDSPLSGAGSLASVLTGGALARQISSVLSGRGTLTSSMGGVPKQIASTLGGEAVLYSELEYIVQPQPLADLPFGKLVRYTVNNAAVPVNPAEGSGSTPSVNATYIKGKNPEFALGENFTVDNGAVGTYTGEIVRLSLNKKSDVATISTDTLLTLTNVDMHLFPFMDTDPGLWTAARAIEYWSQQAGLFYDKVDGECAVYASGFGHPNGYAERAGNSHFYDKFTAGANSTVVLNDRSVTTFGAGSTAVMAQHEATQTRVPVTVGANRKMVFSIGMGLRGSGRTASATYKFLDGLDQSYTVAIEATSAGAVTAKVNDVVASSITVPAGGNYRFTFSLQRMSETSLVVKLTAHEDDLAGNGALIVNGPAKAIPTSIPGTLWLTSLVHASTGGSGAEMLRWGTYLTVSKFHPLTLPRVQKALAQSKKPLGYVSGFTGNVWKSLNEFCSINRMDLTFANDCVATGPRLDGFNGSVKFSDFEVTAERREKYRQVAVVNKQSRAVRDNTAVLWRADSVYQVAAREIFETTVQTEHSILSVVNPVAVTGIWPFPYTEGAGQYVVTGADGYIVSPQWWYDNGGKVEVSLTEKDGEIAIKITPPDIDTVRAPYRISEGEGDRPALYISGSGIINKPEELHINTGAKNAREGFDNVFESPFIATANDAFNTAARMVQTYSAAAAEVSFGTANDFDAPSVLGTYPSGVVFTDNERNFKITDASQTHSQVSGNAIPFTTLAAYKASFPEGATIRDEKVRHLTRTIKHTNIKPLRSNDESA